jgi:plastocyanin
MGQSLLVRGAAALLLLAAACGSEVEPSPAPGSPSAPEAQPARARGGRAEAAPLPIARSEPWGSAELGALSGTVLFRGDAPERFLLGASSAPECKHHPGVDQRSNLVVVNDGKLAGVYVALASGIDRARIPPVPEAPVTLDQKGCMYVPRVLALRAGQVLRVTNEDPTSHNVHTRSRRNPELNRNMGQGQAPLELRFERAERPVPFKCDVHPWMGAAVYVEEHPWFAVSDEAGAFRIGDVPPGEYLLEAHHESLGRASGTVTVKAGEALVVTLTLGE